MKESPDKMFSTALSSVSISDLDGELSWYVAARLKSSSDYVSYQELAIELATCRTLSMPSWYAAARPR